MKLVLQYPPALNAHWRVFRNRILVSAESRLYKHHAALSARAQGARPVEGPCCVTIHLYRPRRAGDLDGRLKVLFDTLNGITWEDDSQVVELHAFRHDDKADPRAEVTVEPVSTP